MPLRLTFMGTPDFAVPTLQALIDSPHEVVAVYTQPPRPAHRGQKDTPSAVHQLAEKHGLPVYTPASLKDPSIQEQFRAHKADAAIVAAYGLLLPKPILEAYPLGCINVHPSLLPRWRGAAPIQRTIMAGDTETGICIMKMAEGLDTGDVYLVERLTISENMNAGELHDLLAQKAGPLVLKTLEGLVKGTLRAQPQFTKGVTYAKKITKDEARIDWSKPAHEIHHLIRGLSPHPGAYFVYEGEKIKILRAELFAPPLGGSSRDRVHSTKIEAWGVSYNDTPHRSTSSRVPPPTRLGEAEASLRRSLEGGAGIPATVLDDRLTITCGDGGAIRPLIVQRPGKRAMSAEEMLRGWEIPIGIRLPNCNDLL